MNRLAIATLLFVGCAHAPQAPREPPDERALLIEFHGSRCAACDLFEREYLPNPAVRAALAHVRFERYDLDTFAGNTAYRRYVGGRGFRPMPSFVGVVGDHTVDRLPGLPPRIARFVEFVDKVAAVGGTEADLVRALDASPNDPSQLARTARWYQVRGRRQDAVRYYTKLAEEAGAAPELRAEGDWYRLLLTPRNVPRESRAALDFARRNPSTTFGEAALSVLVAADDLVAAEIAGVLDVWRVAAHGDPDATRTIAYYALALKQYDLALAVGEQALRLREDAAAYDALAEVHHYRHERDLAVQCGEHAVALGPDRAALREHLERFRRGGDEPSEIVDKIRDEGYRWLPQFYGNGHVPEPTGALP